jgi:hypothetical protein
MVFWLIVRELVATLVSSSSPYEPLKRPGPAELARRFLGSDHLPEGT